LADHNDEADAMPDPDRPKLDPRPTDTTRWEKTPEGLGRGDHSPGMPAAYRSPEIEARIKARRPPGRKGVPWYKQLAQEAGLLPEDPS
jgi:hypothetical protein